MTRKRCPFCAGVRLRMVVNFKGPFFYVYCDGCGSRGSKMASSEGAEGAWNRRCGAEPRAKASAAELRALGLTI